MNKKKGMRIRLRPNLSSSAGAFEKRGNPWVTNKEGMRDFGRQVEIENPDVDADKQRNRHLSKEQRDVLKKDVDFKKTMAGLAETPNFDRYFTDKAPDPFKKSNGAKYSDWRGRVEGRDFEVVRVQRRIANIRAGLRRDISISSDRIARVPETERIACPRSCGFTHTDSRRVSDHIQKHANGCCVHSNSCNCADCRRARNDP